MNLNNGGVAKFLNLPYGHIFFREIASVKVKVGAVDCQKLSKEKVLHHGINVWKPVAVQENAWKKKKKTAVV